MRNVYGLKRAQVMCKHSCWLNKMFFNATLYWCILLIPVVLGNSVERTEWNNKTKKAQCLTGYMTDLQSWVDEYGQLRSNIDNKVSIDVSAKSSVSINLQQQLSIFKCSKTARVKYLSMAKCNLTRVPSVFRLLDNNGRRLSDTVEYVTLYGNNFGMIDPDSKLYDVSLNATDILEMPVPSHYQRKRFTVWSAGFRMLPFLSLRELDLRACSIRALGDYTFQRMPELRKLYLSENFIFYIETRTFASLNNLRHLDLSRNYVYNLNNEPVDMIFETVNVFNNSNIDSVDFSFTRIGQRNVRLLRNIGSNLKRLSLCYSGLGSLSADVFKGTSLKYLDVSGNFDVLGSLHVLRGIEPHLEVMYADGISLNNMNIFMNFSHLEILKLSNNIINSMPQRIAKSLTNLQILDLYNNRITSWFNETFSLMPRLKLLNLKKNNINILSQEIYEDIKKLSYLGLADNFLVCNCHARDVFQVAFNNELFYNNTYIVAINSAFKDFTSFHTGFRDFNDIIYRRRKITHFCERRKGCHMKFNSNVSGNYLFLDYASAADEYYCLLLAEGTLTNLYNVPSCMTSKRDLDIEEELIRSWNKYFLLLIPTIALPLMFCFYFFRKTFKYFLITVRNSATLSLINKNENSDDGTIYNYDVFVSYCIEDRAWVLDELLTHVEKDCNISVCLHERDFQVGLSILENIVSCMDRSQLIMLIISKRFLLSQWCQFEMHLAQHRLLETRREDLILVLLEEIPRRLRPNTLHYLMLTKTYIVWPKDRSEQQIFWKRMKKSLVTHKLKQSMNSSLA